ncbi:TIR-NBS-LRR resistance protein [Trifolium medium]|uniref:TIR-NBS-LRR resistance protein n=1 Tax=Trifolium medium TaxID=97028 RepID=A0A392M3M4_9FABA|nr:TIR-NBS-LRR resistance protein [Trifolium medium]
MLSEIPDNISLLLSLQQLTLIGIGIRSLPETIMHLPRLKQLEVYDCKMLQSIPAFSQFIPFVIIWNCESLEKVLSSTVEPSDKPSHGFVFFNCIPLDPHSYQTVLKDAFLRIELIARLNSELCYRCFLPVMPDIEYWFHYRSTQVSFTLELPPNLLGFSYYLVLSQGHVRDEVDFGCECYLDNSSGERIYITSIATSCIFTYRENTIDMISDHVVLWHDPASCKQIIEEIKAINDVNNTSYSPKLIFEFFIYKSETVTIKECGFHWIYQQEAASSTVFESNDQEQIAPQQILKCLLEELMHIGFGGDNIDTLVGEKK